jgi:pimeloyl-ACP methyl ester carboxylesterase
MSSRNVAVVLLLSALCSTVSATEVMFHNGDVVLAGSLVLPQGSPPFPALVLLHGSGPAPRQWLRPVADRLVASGYACLIYDKRGVGGSTGSWTRASVSDLAEDAAAAVRFLANQQTIDASRIGLWATSQGGWIAPIAAQRSPVAFLVVVTGGGIPPREVEWFGYENALNRNGIEGEGRRLAHNLLRQYFDYLATGEGFEKLQAMIDANKTTSWYSALQLDRVVPTPADRQYWSWIATYDPASDVEKLSVPVLLMFGGKDAMTPPASIDYWSRSLSRSNANVTVRLFPEAGHGITVGETGLHDSAAPRASGFWEMAIAWLNAVTGRAAGTR